MNNLNFTGNQFPNYNTNIRNMPNNYNMSNNYNIPTNPSFYQNSINTNKIFVNGINDVIGRYLPNNSDYIFVDNNEAVIYRKTVDNQGKSNVDIYDIVPREEKKISNYVERSEFEALQKEISNLKEYLPKISEGDK